MAERLTRTKKYAELRNQISNDREESLVTEELNTYQEKLNNVKSQFGRDTEPVFPNKPVINKPVDEKPAITEEVKKQEESSMKSLDDILSSMMNEVYSPTPIKSVDEEPIKPVEQPVQEPVKPQVVEPVQEPVKPQVAEPVQKPVQPVPTNDFVKVATDEAKDYSRKAGNLTIDELPNAMIDNIRHGGEEQVQKEEKEFDEDDFSNTVSLEIEKVLNEIKNQKVEEPSPVVIEEAELVDDIKEEPKQTEVKVEEPQVETPQPVVPTLEKIEPVKEETKEETFEHPVLTKTLEQPVVEIKNINETINMQKPNEDVVDDTIPFNANNVQEEIDEEEFEDEEEGPSKVLNVILGILIFVLVAVLGIIVYYILVAKGIIG